MTEIEAIVFAEKFINCNNLQCEKVKNDCDICEYDFEKIGRISDFVKTAIKAIENQEKIKEVFTHYPFSGFEMDVLDDCISALSEIKTILKESGEE